MTEPVSLNTNQAGGIQPVKIKIKKGDGLTQALFSLVKKQNMTMSDGSISRDEWYATIDKLVEIQNKRDANHKFYAGGSDKFGEIKSNFIIHPNQEIEFSADEIKELYKTMGVSFSQSAAEASAAEEETSAAESETSAAEEETPAAEEETPAAEEETPAAEEEAPAAQPCQGDDGEHTVRDEQGRVTGGTLQDGRTYTREYKEDGSYDDTIVDNTRTENNTAVRHYDAQGKWTSGTTQDGTTYTREYNENGSCVERYDTGEIINYDTDGRVTGGALTNGTTYIQGYNDDGSSVRRYSDSEIVNYDTDGRVTGGALTNGTTYIQEYNADGSSVRTYSDGTTENYDSNGNIVEEQNDTDDQSPVQEEETPAAEEETPAAEEETPAAEEETPAAEEETPAAESETPAAAEGTPGAQPCQGDEGEHTARDEQGRVTGGTLQDGRTYTREYKEDGSYDDTIVDSTRTENNTAVRHYDAQGKWTGGTLNDGTTYTREYNENGSCVERYDTGEIVNYDTDGRVTGGALTNGTTYIQEYEEDGSSVRKYSDGTTENYDSNGNIVEEQNDTDNQSQVQAATIKITRGKGILHALLQLINDQNMIMSDGNISPAEWSAAMDVLIDIQDHRDAEHKLYTGGSDKTGSGRSNFVVQPDQEIEFSAEEMEKLYDALGVSFPEQSAPEETPEEDEETPEET